ncbi:MAG: hypothetical protein AAF612_00180 [Planctomycetota bacterium]
MAVWCVEVGRDELAWSAGIDRSQRVSVGDADRLEALARALTPCPSATKIAAVLRDDLALARPVAGRQVLAWLAEHAGSEAWLFTADRGWRRASDEAIRDEAIEPGGWLAAAELTAWATQGRPGLLIDVGPACTHLTPLRDGRAAPLALHARERLQSGELIWLGGRSPIEHASERISLGGRRTRIVAAGLATLGDALVLAGDLPADPDDRATPDAEPRTRDAAACRLLRAVGRPAGGADSVDALEIACAVRQHAVMRLGDALREVGGAEPLRHVVVAGPGAPLARRVARMLLPGVSIESISEAAGAEAGACEALGFLWSRREASHPSEAADTG